MTRTIYESAFDDDNIKDYDFGSDIVMDNDDLIRPPLNPDNDYQYAVRFYLGNASTDCLLNDAMKSKDALIEFLRCMSDDIVELVNYMPMIKDMSYPQFNGAIDSNDRCKIPVEPVKKDGIYVDGDVSEDSLYDRLKKEFFDSFAVAFKFNIIDENNNYPNIIKFFIDFAGNIKKMLTDDYGLSVWTTLYNISTNEFVNVKVLSPEDIISTMKQISEYLCKHSISIDDYPKSLITKYSKEKSINNSITLLFNDIFNSWPTCDKPYMYDRKANCIVVKPKGELLKYIPKNIGSIDGRDDFKAFKFDLSDTSMLQIPIDLDNTDRLNFIRILERYICKFPPMVSFIISLSKNTPVMNEETTFGYIKGLNFIDMDFKSVPFDNVSIRCPWKSERIRSILPFKFADNVNIKYL